MTTKKFSETLTEFTNAVGQDIKVLTQKDAQIEQSVSALQQQLASGSVSETRVNQLLTAQKSELTQSLTQAINAAKTAVKSEILGGVANTYDTLKEIADYIATDKSTGASLATAVGNRVRYDETQTLTAEQQKTAAANIGLGDISTDFLAIYNRAKA